jgi:hypothetical protein
MPDFYLLSRMFKEFDLINKPAFANAMRNDQPKEAHNIVIYAGDGHSQRCRRFLNQLNFIEVGKTGQSENKNYKDSCINMKYIYQPFFSKESKKRMVVPQEDRYTFNYSNNYDNDPPLGDPMVVDVES